VPKDNPLVFKHYYTDRYLFKLNWQISQNHKVVGNFHYDKKTTDNGPRHRPPLPPRAWTRHSKTPTPGLSYTGVLSNKTVLEVRYSGFYQDVHRRPHRPQPAPRPCRASTTSTPDSSAAATTTGTTCTPGEPRPRQKISHLADKFLGASHDFHFGVQYSDAVAKGLYGYNDFVYTYTLNGVKYGYGYDRQPLQLQRGTAATSECSSTTPCG